MCLAAAVPWIAYVFTCSGHAYWLDSGEFVAASVRLDISHPPGHPLSLLYGKAWSLVPLGSLAFRLALGQAFATALACAWLCLAAAAVLKTQGVSEALRWPCALFAALVSAFTYGLWFQAVRPEVYALQTLCTSLILERGASFQADPRAPPARYAGPACLAFGLGLSNHHFSAILGSPALLVPALLLVRRGRLRVLLGAAGLGLLALATYAYLPLRAAQPLAANLGQPDTWSRFWWVVSARVYSQGTLNRDGFSLGERLADELVLLVDSFRALPLLAAIVGLYVLLRVPRTRAQGWFLLLSFAPMLFARAWLGPVRSNPDVLGYFGGALLAIGILAASGIAALLSPLAAPYAGRRWLQRLAFVVPALALLNLPFALPRSTLADFTATDSFDELRARSLPPRSVAVETMPQTVFRHWELDAVERVRPDIASVPVSFLSHPGMRDAIVKREPQLARVVDGYLAGDVLRCDDLIALSGLRPTWLELDPRVPPACYSRLVPGALLHRVQPLPPPAAVRAKLASTHLQLQAAIGDDAADLETMRQLLAFHYLNAVQLAALGARTLAREEIARALELAPSDQNAVALARALDEGEGPLAVAPFLAL